MSFTAPDVQIEILELFAERQLHGIDLSLLSINLKRNGGFFTFFRKGRPAPVEPKSRRTGGIVGKNHRFPDITEEQKSTIRKLSGENLSNREIEKRTGIGRNRISKCLHGE